MQNIETKELTLIKNNPKKAIRFLSLPIMASLIFMILNNLIDSAWVSALGAQPLAAVGFVTPLFMALVGLGTGLGAGANSVISRFIGSENKADANNAALHSILIILLLTIVLTAVCIIFLDPILIVLGAGDVLNFAGQYGFWIILGLYSMTLPNVLGAIFRTEGAVKRATYPLIVSAIANMFIDPIFIFTLNLGVSGAAIATIISQTVFGLLPMVYWIFIKKDTYLDVSFKHFKSQLSIYKDILIVGIPASLEEIILAALAAIVNLCLSILSGTVAVAVFSATWRIISLGITPAIAVGMSAVTVIGVSYGAKNWTNFKLSFKYATEFAAWISIAVFVLFYIFAGELSMLFSFSANSAELTPLIVTSIRNLVLYIILTSFGLIATYYFQSIGKGLYSLAFAFLREIVCCIIFIVLFGFILNWGTIGVYIGLVVGGAVGSLISYLAARYHLSKVIKENTI